MGPLVVKEMMPILGHGNYKNHCGFTLIEILLVLLVIGISLGVIVPLVAKSDHDLLVEESSRLAQLFNYASNESVATGKTLSWEMNSHGYRFLEWDPQAEVWKPIIGDSILKARSLPEVLQIGSASTQNQTLNRILFSPSSVHAPFMITLKNQSEQIRLEGNLIGKVTLSNPSQ
jgi:general secretion pathway protein H